MSFPFAIIFFLNKSNENSHAAARHSGSHLLSLTPAAICLMQHLTFRPQHYQPVFPQISQECGLFRPEQETLFPSAFLPRFRLSFFQACLGCSPDPGPPPHCLMNSLCLWLPCGQMGGLHFFRLEVSVAV